MTWLWVTLAVLLVGCVALVGGLLPERWLDRYRLPMLGFAVGTLLASGVGKIAPESLAITGLGGIAWIAGAMLAMAAIERRSRRSERHASRPLVPIALLGSDAFHNIGDGMAIAAAFLVSPRLGVFTAAAVLLHELPEEVADYALLRIAGVRKRNALLGLAGVQLTAGIGAAGTLLASTLIARANGVILAIASGLFVYIAVFDLLPVLIRARSRSGFLAIALGAAAVLAIS